MLSKPMYQGIMNRNTENILDAQTLWMLKKREQKYAVGDYMLTQPQINATMRGILVDWMADVNAEFEQADETLFLAVRLVDRLLAAVAVPRKELQLAGCVCVLVAAKVT